LDAKIKDDIINRFSEIDNIKNIIGDQGIGLHDFQTKVKEHLGEYKRSILNISEDGIYNYKNKEIRYEYILHKDKYKLNIIEKYRSSFFHSDYYKRITLHKYFHHLNSSQAMCINFFYPLIEENLLKSILNIMGIEGEINYNHNDICFEKVSKIETNVGRKINFDFYMKLDSGIKIYFEIKYTENGFGKIKKDKEHKVYKDHKKKFYDIYMPLIKNNPAIKESFKTEEKF